MMKARPFTLLPEEDALDDPDEDGDADPTVPGDLWFRVPAPRMDAAERWKGHRILAGGHLSGN